MSTKSKKRKRARRVMRRKDLGALRRWWEAADWEEQRRLEASWL